MSKAQGQYFETLACQYLTAQGLRLKACNYRCRFGEIDLVMQHGDTLVFVEVKYRKNSQFGSAASMVTTSKQHKLQVTASFYLQQHRWLGSARFDVLAISGEPPYQLDWLKSAF